MVGDDGARPMTNPTTRSQARYARAAGVLPKITLPADAEHARAAIVAQTGEQTAALIRRLLVEEAARLRRSATLRLANLSDVTG